jgi:hypothetical protein
MNSKSIVLPPVGRTKKAVFHGVTSRIKPRRGNVCGWETETSHDKQAPPLLLSNILEDRDAPQNSFVSISLADSRFIGNARFLFLFSAIQDF